MSRICVLLAVALALPPAAVAITINIEYSTDFDGEENPDWDENGFILISHFQAAKQIWEALLPGSGEVSFDFQWDDDLGADTNGLYTPGLDEYIEINPLQFWFADPTPNDSSEFGVPTQTLYSQVSPELQSSHFPATTPPAGLEVGYRAAGIATSPTQNTLSLSGQMVPADIINGIPAGPADAFNSKDLLSTVLHEIGHALGLSGIEPGNYNILPEHVGGLSGVEVLEGGGGHLAGQGNVPYLMCESCGATGVRRFATATDILVIAEELEVSNVHLARVGRISAGNWNDTNAWIGADVPDATQDAYVRQAGAVTLDVNAVVKSLDVGGGGSVDVTGFQLTSLGDVSLVGGTLSVGAGGKIAASAIRFDGGAISAGAGGTISADAIHGDPATLTTAAGSTIEFNNFTRGTSSATAATFNGNVRIGVGASDDVTATFNPDTTIATWTIGQDLKIGGSRPAKLVIDNGAWSVGGNLDMEEFDIQGFPSEAEVVVTGGPLGGTLDVSGSVTIGLGGALTYMNHNASNTTYTLRGGTTAIKIVPLIPPFLTHDPPGLMTFEGTNSAAPVSAGTAIINVGGGAGDGGMGAVVTFKGESGAGDAEFWNESGVGGASLRISNPVVIAGTGGSVVFKDGSKANTAHFRNDGVNAHGPQGSGGGTYFGDNSKASGAVFDNYGSTLTGYTGAVPAPGGRTEFFDNSSATFGTFNNHPGQGMGALGAGVTIFHGSSTANFGHFYNKGGVTGLPYGGSTEFYDTATAGDAQFYNEHGLGLAQGAATAGNVRFYGSSTAERATFHNEVGGGTVFFNDASTAGDAHFFIEDTGTGTFAGHVIFQGSSKGGTADLTIGANAFSATIEFKGTSNAEQAEIALVDGSQAYVAVTNSGSLGQAHLDIGSGGSLTFRESATAANATIRIRPGGSGDFTGTLTTAADSTITLDGATVFNGGVAGLNFTQGSAGNATIYVNGGAVSGAAGAYVNFNNGANLGTARVIGGSAGVAGAGGGRITVDTSSNFTNAQFTIGTAGYIVLNGLGTVTIGSIDGTGAVYLQQNELRTGGLNASTIISGPLIGVNANSKLTKVGTGTLLLTGANTYTGLTKVDGGTLAINGTTPGAVEVNNGAMLNGTGSIGGIVTLNSGGTLAPGTSPGKITVGGLNLSSTSTLAMELGGTTAGTQYDQVVSTGVFSLAGALNVSLVNGFAPSAGQSFNLFDWGTLSGTFSTLSLPTLGSTLGWNTSQLYTTGVLSVLSAGTPGDFDNDGDADGRDFLAWQRGESPNPFSAGDLAAWQAAYNGGLLSALRLPPSALNVAVPEPSSGLLLLFAVAAGIVRVRARRT